MALSRIDANLLQAIYSTPTDRRATTLASSATPTKKVAPTPPWRHTPTAAETSETVKAVLAGKKLIDENATKLDLPGASTDYKKLFALYQGLGSLYSLAEHALAKGLTQGDKAKLDKVFQQGLTDVLGYAKAVSFEKLRLTTGETSTSATSDLGAPKPKAAYVTPPLTSSPGDPVAAFQGEVRFRISITRLGVRDDVDIDLDELGDQPRTLANVINFVNARLQDAGVETRLATERIPGEARTVKAGSKTITLPPNSDRWALKVKVGTSEKVEFSTPATAGAVYLAQSVGAAPKIGASGASSGPQVQFLKFQTDTDEVGAPPQGAGQANWVDGRVFAETLGTEITTVRSQVVGPDGGVYLLADASDKTGGQTIKGKQDVALVKYDSAGKLVFTRTLGASDTASGLALAVAPDGKIAIAGSVKGGLLGATEGPLNSGTSGGFAGLPDSFVTLLDAEGEEVWTARRGAREDDEANAITFGDDGVIYVAGRAKSALPGTATVGGWDGYIEAFDTTSAGKPEPLFAQTFGTSGSDRPVDLVVDGDSLMTASIESGHGVLRRFILSNAGPALAATYDLGDLEGGDLGGLALDGDDLVLAGSTSNTDIGSGVVTRAASGGVDAFVLRITADLAPEGTPKVAYYGGSSDDRATALAVSEGQVWIAGTTRGALKEDAASGTTAGFLVRLDPASGELGWERRFSGKDGAAAPTAIAFDPAGASVLDRLGLPSGVLDLGDSERLTALSSLRPGDQFTLSTNGGAAQAVTIEAADTLDTLAQKVRRACGFAAKVSIVTADGSRRLKIEPGNPHVVIEIGAGKTDKDALQLVGLPEGVVRATTTKNGKTTPADGKAQFYGLSLPGNLNLSNDVQIHHALAEIALAQGVVRSAYKDLVAAVTPKSATAAAAAAVGKAPAYMKAQIANYQAALDRLAGGG
jgi:hypothetical protein